MNSPGIARSDVIIIARDYQCWKVKSSFYWIISFARTRRVKTRGIDMPQSTRENTGLGVTSGSKIRRFSNPLCALNEDTLILIY